MNVFVLGSPTSREILDYSGDKLAAYVPRCSLASAFSAPLSGIDLSAISDEFTRSVVACDVKSELEQMIRTTPFDLFLYDPLEERFDIGLFQDGAACTLSNELIRSRILSQEKMLCRIRSGSEEHYRLWEQGWRKLLSVLDLLGFTNKLRINEIYFASHTESGAGFEPIYNAAWIRDKNAYLKRLYERIRKDLDDECFYQFSEDLLIGADGHKWGKGPFHYRQAYYESAARCLAKDNPRASFVEGFPAPPQSLRSVEAQLAFELQGREIRQYEAISFGDAAHAMTPLISNGEFIKNNGCVWVTFDYEKTIGLFRVPLPAPVPNGSGLTALLYLGMWEKIDYLALGFTDEIDGKTFRHVKINNPKRDAWDIISIDFGSLIYRIQNGFADFIPTTISDARFYIKGKPKPGGAVLGVGWIAAWAKSADAIPETWIAQETGSRFATRADAPEALVNVLVDYFAQCNPKAWEHAKGFLETGKCPIANDVWLEWPAGQRLPEGLHESGTYRYMWHALQPMIALLVYGVQAGQYDAIKAAYRFADAWIATSFEKPDPDVKYAWYDHGTAERTLGLILLHGVAELHGFELEVLSRLRAVIFEHAVLLESEAFYAYHQPFRFHNHAWFQDIALMAAAAAFPRSPQSPRWRMKALHRLDEQINALLVEDDGFVVFVENSIGYHQGIQRLLAFASEVSALSGGKNDVSSALQGVDRWTSYYRYPDGRTPANGDTFRRPNPTNAAETRRYSVREVSARVLPKAGYAVAHGVHDRSPWTLAMTASNINRTHKHDDHLSFTLWFDGVEWLIDPSFYSHEYGDPLPRFLRSASAHNACIVEGAGYDISPGKATLSGSVDDDKFSFLGSHNAISGYEIRRVMEGKLSRLSLAIRDEIIATNELSPMSDERGLLCIQVGDGVNVTLLGSQVRLSHPASTYTLRLSFASEPDEVTVVRGFAKSRALNGVSGLGFQQQVATYGIFLHLPAPGIIEWFIEAESGGAQGAETAGAAMSQRRGPMQ